MRRLSWLVLVCLAGLALACSQQPAPTPEPPPQKQEPEWTPEKPGPEKPKGDADYWNAQGVLRRIHFDFDRSDIRADQVPVLEANARWVNDHPQFRLLIEGHCDERDTEEYNLALGERRASATRDYMIRLGVDASRITIVSYGEERPMNSGHNESAWSQNRRAEFTLQD